MPASPLFCSQKPSWSFAHRQPRGNKGGWWVNSRQCLPLQRMGLPLPSPPPGTKPPFGIPFPAAPPLPSLRVMSIFLWMVFDS